MERQLVVFVLANEFYGVDIAAVERIIKWQPITTIPYAPPFIEGVTHWSGLVLPVIDLRKRFELSMGDITRDTRIVVVQMRGVMVGLLVDGVTEVLKVSEEQIDPPSPIVTTVDSTFITGIAKMGGEAATAGTRLIILLDLEKVLSTDEQTELLETLEQAEGEPSLKT